MKRMLLANRCVSRGRRHYADRCRAQRCTRLEVPARVAKALNQAGFPARKHCGFIDTPTVPGCWVTIERSGYSVYVVPHRSLRDAGVVYRRLRNPWATGTRIALVGRITVSGFRVPAREWQTILTIVRHAAR
jgi:hypothetical protein